MYNVHTWKGRHAEVSFFLVKDQSEETEMKSFQSKMTLINKDCDLECIFNEHTLELVFRSQEFQERGSGWSLLKFFITICGF